jgi:hypothetical protein
MTIRANIEEVIVEIQKEIEELGPAGGEFSQEVKLNAIAAILGGDPERVVYMKHYAKTSAELARLVPNGEAEEDPERREARAYLIANAVCAPATATGLINNVFDRLD